MRLRSSAACLLMILIGTVGCSRSSSTAPAPTDPVSVTTAVPSTGEGVVPGSVPGTTPLGEQAPAEARIDHVPGLAPEAVESIALATGSGPVATSGDQVSVRYTARNWETGEVLDGTTAQTDFEFVLGAGYAGPVWDAGLQGVQTGATRRIVMRAGDQGPVSTATDIPVVYDIEVVSVTPRASAPAEVASGFDAATVADELARGGLSVEELAAGTGTAAAAGSRIGIHYTAYSAESGAKVVSTWDLGQPVWFVVGSGDVIAGLEQGVVGMAPGARRRLTVPADLAYGDQGTPGKEVAPGESLVYFVEMMSGPA